MRGAIAPNPSGDIEMAFLWIARLCSAVYRNLKLGNYELDISSLRRINWH